MRTGIAALATTALLLAASGSARAGRLLTPPITRNSTQDQRLSCTVVNGGNKPIGPVTISIFRQVSSLAASLTFNSIPPGAGQVIGATPGNLGTAVFGYCVVEGPGVSKNKTPVTLCLQPANGNDCIAAVSIP